MDETLKTAIQAGESKHKRYRLLYRRGINLENYARRGFSPFTDGQMRGILSLVGRAVLLVILFAVTQNLLYTVLGYLLIHGLAAILGRILHSQFEKKLDRLRDEYNAILSRYYTDQEEKYDIVGGTVIRDDLSIESGFVMAGMRQDYGTIRIYQLDKLDNPNEYSAFLNRGLDPALPQLAISEKLASVAFKKKFGVCIEPDKEIETLRYLSPALQVKMLEQWKAIAKFSNISIANSIFHADTSHKVVDPVSIDIYARQPLGKYFDDVDRYCAQMLKMADAVWEEMKQIDFLLG